MAINYPTGCNTFRDRLHFCIFVAEVLRKIHNRFGYWYKNTITQTQYDNNVNVLAHVLKRIKYPGQTINQLETAISNKYPYTSQLSESQWDTFKNEDFNPMNYELSGLIVDFKNDIKTSVEWDLNEIPELV